MRRLSSVFFHITLRRILLLRLAGVLFLIVVIGLVCAMALKQADTRIQSLVDDTLAPISDVGRIQSDFNNDYQVLSHAVLMRLPSAVDDAATAIKSNRIDLDRYWKPLMQSGLGAQQKQLLSIAVDHRKDAEQAMDDTLTLLQAGQFDIAQLKLATDVQPDLVPLQSDVNNLFESALKSGSTQALAQHAAYRSDVFMLLAVFTGAVLLACLTDGFLIRALGARLRLASNVAQRIARGELGQAVDTGRSDEIGDLLCALSAMDKQLADVVRQVRAGASNVRDSATHLADNTHALSQRTQAQAANLEESSASMEEMAASVAEAVAIAEQTDRIADASRKLAEHGKEVVEQTVVAMDAIDQSGQRIAEYAGLINDVAFQTNLLALNAAVEAARAGEHGRGFAVVAAEVRQLAQRCASAARDVRRSIEESNAAVSDGRTHVKRSGEALIGIVTSAAQVSEKVASMALSGREQKAGIDQVTRAVASMDSMTQENASLVERTAMMSHTMRDSAEQLLQQMAFFHIDEIHEVAAATNTTDASAWMHHVIRQHQKHPTVDEAM